MKILLHCCCGPCTIYPLTQLINEGIDTTCYFFNPNIHPYKEFKKRIEGFKEYIEVVGVNSIINDTYGLQEFVRKVSFKEKQRCSICYDWRLESTARLASEQKFDSFSTTLLYSRYQNHEKLIEVCQQLANKYSISFKYEDYREGWQYGIDKSIELKIYRQPYCGCIYSEQERYDKSLRKK